MTAKSASRQALVYGLVGFALLSLGDSLIKSIAGSWPGTAVAALRFLFGAIGLGLILWWKEGRAGFRAPRWGLQIARGAALASSSLLFFLAIFAMPLAEATAIQFANPMLTALISAWLLGERAPRAAWAASVAGFIGVLIVLRPNLEILGVAALLPLGAALGMAFLMTFNRMAATDTSPLAAQFFVAAIAAAILVPFALIGDQTGLASLAISWPSASIVARCAIVAATATCAHALVFAATRRASSAAIAPTVYVQIIAATLIGIGWFGDWPDATAVLGTLIIIAAGLGLWYFGSRPQQEPPS